MILNFEREPDLSLYYLGSVLLNYIKDNENVLIDDLIEIAQNQLKKKVHVDFIYYALDWLYLLSLIHIEKGRVYYEVSEINS